MKVLQLLATSESNSEFNSLRSSLPSVLSSHPFFPQSINTFTPLVVHKYFHENGISTTQSLYVLPLSELLQFRLSFPEFCVFAVQAAFLVIISLSGISEDITCNNDLPESSMYNNLMSW